MPAYVFSHVILTVILLLMFTLTSFFFLTVLQSTLASMERRGLETVASIVASKLVHLADYANSTVGEAFMYKVVRVPEDINERTYNVTLRDVDGKWFIVTHYTIVSGGKPMLNGSFNITEAVENVDAVVQVQPMDLPSSEVSVNASINSGYLYTKHNGYSFNLVVWCWRKLEAGKYKIYIGLGLIRRVVVK